MDASNTDDAWQTRKRQLMVQPFVHAVTASAIPIVLTDPGAPDNPIVFANDAFLRLTGYPEREALGRNCRFLQGPDTDRETVRRLREGIEAREVVRTEILNYRRDGTPFWNELHVAPVFDDTGDVSYFIASQVDVTDRVQATRDLASARAELEARVAERTRALEEAARRSELLAREVTHRVRNSLTLLSSMIELQRRTAATDDARAMLREVQGRIAAVGRIQGLLDGVAVDERAVALRPLLATLCCDLDLSASVSVRLAPGAEVVATPEQALPVALVATELVLNAQKHAFAPGTEGEVVLSLGREDDRVVMAVEDDGCGLPAGFDPAASHGTGMLVVRSQLGRIGGRLHAGAGAAGGARLVASFPAG
ncbi:MAG: PAS domain-containing protein [Paracoccaceae bacterium]